MHGGSSEIPVSTGAQWESRGCPPRRPGKCRGSRLSSASSGRTALMSIKVCSPRLPAGCWPCKVNELTAHALTALSCLRFCPLGPWLSSPASPGTHTCPNALWSPLGEDRIPLRLAEQESWILGSTLISELCDSGQVA